MTVVRTKARKSKDADWQKVVNDYHRRHRQWVMEVMPTMHETEWARYIAWVSGFGAKRMGLPAYNGRKVRKRLKTARKYGPALVTVPVTVDRGRIGADKFWFNEEAKITKDQWEKMANHQLDALRQMYVVDNKTHAGIIIPGRATRRK